MAAGGCGRRWKEVEFYRKPLALTPSIPLPGNSARN
jgi:hypothetical protein